MNKDFNINIFLYFLFSCLLIIVLFLHIFYIDFILIYNTNMFCDYLWTNDDLFNTLNNSENRSLNNPETTSYSGRSSSSCSCSSCSCSCSCSNRSISLLTTEHKHRFGFIIKYKEASKNILNKIKNNINNKAKYATHKIKNVDRTLSWIFRGSKPGGGRGL